MSFFFPMKAGGTSSFPNFKKLCRVVNRRNYRRTQVFNKKTFDAMIKKEIKMSHELNKSEVKGEKSIDLVGQQSEAKFDIIF